MLLVLDDNGDDDDDDSDGGNTKAHARSRSSRVASSTCSLGVACSRRIVLFVSGVVVSWMA